MLKNKFTYKKFFVYFFSFIIFLCLTNVIPSFKVLSLPFYVSLLYLNFNIVGSTIIYLLSFLYDVNLTSIYSALISSLILLSIFSLYRKKNRKMGGESIFYIALSLSGFLYLTTAKSITFKLIVSALALILSFVFISATRVVFIKNFNYKILAEEKFCLAIFTILLGLGVISVFNVSLLKSINIYIILFSMFTLGGGTTMIISIILSVPMVLFSQSLDVFCIFPLLTLSLLIFYKNSKILSTFALMGIDLILMLFTNVYPTFIYADLIYLITPIVVFLFTPNSIITSTKEKIIALNGKFLSRYTVNRVRASISNRLYSISDVFSEMEKSFNKLKECVSTDADLISRMADEVIMNVCEKCPQYIRCKQNSEPDRRELLKILSVGVAKNRISLVDLTKKFTENCGYINGIIFEINELIHKYHEKVKESEDVLSGKELIRMQSEGVAGVLKGMAFEYSKNLDYSIDIEKKIAESLKKNGILFHEIMCYTRGEELEINLIIKNEYIKDNRLINSINNATSRSNTIVLKTSVSSNMSAVTIKRSPTFDAAFGIASKTKNNSSISGDTHTLTKIDEGKFLIALSDGMGSGFQAENTSSTAISLIESFYKAGLNSKLILSMVNKVLALNTDDNFSAMDILTVNLFDLNADFIKIGAPYSFILSDSTIKIIEGSSLPLGILDDLTPTGCNAVIDEGSTIIMVTDGISDAFGSTTDLIDFLRTIDNKNPQFIADSILNKALNNDRNIAKDDMTVLAVRIFKKVS